MKLQSIADQNINILFGMNRTQQISLGRNLLFHKINIYHAQGRIQLDPAPAREDTDFVKNLLIIRFEPILYVLKHLWDNNDQLSYTFPT